MTVKKKKSKKKPDFSEEIIKKERKWFKEWNPEIMLVTVVGILMILGISAVAAAKIGEVHADLSKTNEQLDQKITTLNNKITGLNNEITRLKAAGPAGGCMFDIKGSTLCDMKEGLDTKLRGTNFKIPLESNTLCTNTTACLPEHGKARILRFVSPTCPFCDAQMSVLDKVSAKYPLVEVKNVCLNIHPGDEQLCKENQDAYDIPYEEGMQLAQIFHVSGTPTMVVDCVYSRVGSYALLDQRQNTTNEEQDLESLFSALSA